MQPGTRLGPYEIVAPLGTGGMGHVYRARDERLDRTVAIKVLSPGLAADQDFHARFEREARLLASLNHPHIAQIYGVEQTNDVRAIVMELVEGDTLSDRIDRAARPMSMTRILTIARQIADALAAAHDHGIIHRDLKPSNIKITPDGDVKVLDFGIAKRSAAAGSIDHGFDGVTERGTLEGTIVGTAAYMSPEQAQGEPVDARTDIWAFGCVLYEMLTRRRAFDGSTSAATIAKVIEREPDWHALPSDTSPAIRRLIERCLKKDRSARLRDIGDAGLEIADVQATPSRADSTFSTRRSAGPAWWVALAAMAIVTVVTIAWALTRSTAIARPPQPMVFGLKMLDNYIATSLAVSPDNRYLAVALRLNISDVWLHSFETGEAHRLPGTETYQFPFWSPDGSRFGIFGAGNLRIVSVADGSSTVLCQLPRPAGGSGGTWSTSGDIVFANGGELFKIAATGGTSTPLPTSAQSPPAFFPQFLSDERHIVFFDAPPTGPGTIRVRSIDSGDTKELVASDAPGVFVPPNHVLFVRGPSLYAQRLNQAALTLEGTPSLVAPNASLGVLFMSAALLGPSTSDLLAFGAFRGGALGQLTWFDRTNGRATTTLPIPPGTEDLHPAISPAGDRIAVDYMDPQTGDWDVWIVDAASGARSRLTTAPGRDTDPVWSPDGREVAFISNRGGKLGLYRKAVAGSTPEDLLLDLTGASNAVTSDWTPDGKYIIYHEARPTPWTVMALPLSGDDRKPIRVVAGAAPYGARVSPDGRWVAYGAFDNGPAEVYVQRFLAPGQKQQVSHGGGVHPRWTQNGRELAYWAIPGGVDAVEFRSAGESFTIGPRRTLMQSPVLSLVDARSHYDVTRDGTRILARQPAGTQRPAVNVLLNWTERLKP